MRVTAIAQGINKWLDSLHRQVPLTGRESQRLLNALTNSFRKQLDEAHPTKAQEDLVSVSRPTSSKLLARVQSTERPAKSPNGSVHTTSAVESADRHLASVLTSPLMMGPAPIIAKPSPRKGSSTKLSPGKIKETAKAEPVPIRKIFATKSTLKPSFNQPTPIPTKSKVIARSPQETKLLQSSLISPDENVLTPAVKASKVSGDQQPHHPPHSKGDNPAQPGLARQKVSSRPVNDDDDEAHSDRHLWYPLARAAP
jgi:hypothetical protein